MIVEIYELSFHVFVCAFHLEISSFFGKSFPFRSLFFLQKLIILTSEVKSKNVFYDRGLSRLIHSKKVFFNGVYTSNKKIYMNVFFISICGFLSPRHGASPGPPDMEVSCEYIE